MILEPHKRHPWWARFLQKTVRIPRDEDQEVGCLIWVGAQSRGGDRPRSNPYGSFWVSGVVGSVRAHIASAHASGLLEGLRTPEGYHVDHECRRSLCVEPRHLRLLPGKDNCALSFQGSRPLSEEQEEAIRYRNTRMRTSGDE